MIYEMGNVEMFELGQISMTVQCHSCLKHVPEGLKLCGCGVRLRPDEETINKIRARFQALIVPYYLTQVKRSRGKKHGEAHWQQDHHTAMDAKGGAWKNNKHTSVLSRWKKMNNTESHSWIWGGLRHTAGIWTSSRRSMSPTTPYHQRNRYDNTTTLKSSDPNHQSGPMWQREDYRATSKGLVNLRAEHGRNPTFIPKLLRTRQRNTLDPDLQRNLECLSENRKTFLPTS